MWWYEYWCYHLLVFYIFVLQITDLVKLQTLPDDLKTKLSIDDDSVSSPKEALSRASADRRMKYLNRYILISFTYLTYLIKKLTCLLLAFHVWGKIFWMWLKWKYVEERNSWCYSHGVLLQWYFTVIFKSKRQDST